MEWEELCEIQELVESKIEWTPKFTVEIKELNVDISKDGGSKEVGIIIKNVDISSGEITLNLNEELLLKSKSSSQSSSSSGSIIGPQADSVSKEKPSKKQQKLAAFSKYSSMFPEKVNFDLPKLDLLREAGSSILEILKVDLVSFVYIPVQKRRESERKRECFERKDRTE
ncbi:hypothetical protein SESBI_11442 [Sesbania bispinosa]|nr:hypothetical protein SESBI_11442 [Sesbania bispinosa]